MSFYDLDTSPDTTRAEKLVAKDADGSKQHEKVSEHAPSHVDDAELLARSLEFPSKFLDGGGLNDSLFQDAYTHGASAQRLPEGWVTHEVCVHKRFENRAIARRAGSDGKRAKPDFTYIGSFHMTARELRDTQLPAEQVKRVRVYDAGTDPADPLHAEIIADATGLEKLQRHELRVQLMNLAQKRGLYVSPFLNEEGMRRATSSQCALVQPSEQTLTTDEQAIVNVAKASSATALPSSGDIAA
ncbi:hypothetical protein WJ542_17095 [Paraburkholderia sp. B3]|uniref:hypothetical protein n=1 Tax=Paraburkholderia sp. B3 TaxID=3134791 RepID=UPI003981EC62